MCKVKSRSAKFANKFDGPFRVVSRENDIYTIEHISSKVRKERHTSSLKPYHTASVEQVVNPNNDTESLEGSEDMRLATIALLATLVSAAKTETRSSDQPSTIRKYLTPAPSIGWVEEKARYVSNGTIFLPLELIIVSPCNSLERFPRQHLVRHGGSISAVRQPNAKSGQLQSQPWTRPIEQSGAQLPVSTKQFIQQPQPQPQLQSQSQLRLPIEPPRPPVIQMQPSDVQQLQQHQYSQPLPYNFGQLATPREDPSRAGPMLLGGTTPLISSRTATSHMPRTTQPIPNQATTSTQTTTTRSSNPRTPRRALQTHQSGKWWKVLRRTTKTWSWKRKHHRHTNAPIQKHGRWNLPTTKTTTTNQPSRNRYSSKSYSTGHRPMQSVLQR